MADDSYSLREVAELLGVSKRSLQRRMREGAFPNRFLSPGRHGLETRIPIDEVHRVLEEIRRHGREQPRNALSLRARPDRTLVPDAPIDSLVPAYDASVDHISSSPIAQSALTQTDLQSLRDAMLAIVREEREMFLAAVRSALTLRDREIAGLKDQVAQMRDVMDDVRSSVERLDRRVRSSDPKRNDLELDDWLDVLTPQNMPIDRESLLQELGELESLLGLLKGE